MLFNHQTQFVMRLIIATEKKLSNVGKKVNEGKNRSSFFMSRAAKKTVIICTGYHMTKCPVEMTRVTSLKYGLVLRELKRTLDNA